MIDAMVKGSLAAQSMARARFMSAWAWCGGAVARAWLSAPHMSPFPEHTHEPVQVLAQTSDRCRRPACVVVGAAGLRANDGRRRTGCDSCRALDSAGRCRSGGRSTEEELVQR